MIRVYFRGITAADVVEANNCAVGEQGELVLNNAEVGQVTDPQTFKPVSVVKAVTWVRTYGPTSLWTYAEPVKDDGVPEAPAELQEVYR